MKSCNRCKAELPLSMFYVYRKALDGICKVCRRAAARLIQAAKRRRLGIKPKVEKPYRPAAPECDLDSPASRFLRLPRVVL